MEAWWRCRREEEWGEGGLIGRFVGGSDEFGEEFVVRDSSGSTESDLVLDLGAKVKSKVGGDEVRVGTIVRRRRRR